MAGAALGLFLRELQQGSSLETARTMAVCVVVIAEMLYLLNSRHLYRTALSREGLLGNHHALIAIGACAILQAAFVHLGWLQRIFGTTDLSAGEWLRVILAGAMVFVVAEFEKAVVRRWRANGRDNAARARRTTVSEPSG